MNYQKRDKMNYQKRDNHAAVNKTRKEKWHSITAPETIEDTYPKSRFGFSM